MLAEKNNAVYCPVIFKGMYVERRDADTSVIAPCCAAQAQSCSNDQVDFDKNPFLLRLRQENQAGIASKECSICWNSEKYTGQSLRTSSIEFYAQHRDSGLHNLDWNVEPICNAKCIICSNYHSSAWLAEDQKFSDTLFPISRSAATTRRNNIIETINFEKIVRVYFNGGEPVLSQDPVNILRKLEQINKLSQVEVGFNMNASCMPSQELTALLLKAASVTVYFSIDGTGPQFEYIRYPLCWATVTENIQKVMQLGFDRAVMTTALGIHNLHIIQQTQDWWHQVTESYANQIDILHTHQLVIGPLSIDSAGAALQYQLQQEFSSTVSATSQLILKCLDVPAGSDQWIAWLNRLDGRRSSNWRDTLPNLYKSARLAGIVK